MERLPPPVSEYALAYGEYALAYGEYALP